LRAISSIARAIFRRIVISNGTLRNVAVMRAALSRGAVCSHTHASAISLSPPLQRACSKRTYISAALPANIKRITRATWLIIGIALQHGIAVAC